ncbi:CHAP domain-containing protein [Nonomuraea sp. NPDC046570]|uniref:CHAP domain-containing protein n=1 Tax=Nonomuraea sp. NPDC046570 TaxID=3155255 RepID=UPI0033E02A81
MTPETQKLIDLLEKELGYAERSGAYTKFGDWYGKNIEFDADYSSAPWCDMFLSWAADKLGYQDWVGQFAYTVAHAKWFKEQDAWGTKPKPGALVFYDWSGSNRIDKIDHVGIVTRVEGNTIFTIEGNIDGGVAKRKERDQSKVVGYGYPETVKARLDAIRLKEAQEAERDSQVGDTRVGHLQLPAEPELSTQIPQAGPARPQPLAKPAAKPTRQADKPAATVTPQSAPAAKPGKHAKPAAADTEAVTREPITAFKDAAATTPVPSLGSPALIGPVLLAALGALALARTKQLRVRLAPIATAPARKPNRRAPGRRRKTSPLRVLTPTPVPPLTTLMAADPATTTSFATADRVVTTADLVTADRFATAAELVTTTGFMAADEFAAAAGVRTAGAMTAATPVIAATTIRTPAAMATAGSMDASLVGTAGSMDASRVGTGPSQAAISAGAEVLTPLSRSAFAALAAPATADGPGSAFESAVRSEPPGAVTAEFDALVESSFGPPRRNTASMLSGRAGHDGTTDRGGEPYQGRRRRRERAQDERAFTPDAPLRGRRHRLHDPAVTTRVHRTTETFSSDAPLRGRRHRGASPTTTAARDPRFNGGSGHPASLDSAGPGRDTRGGRHRA